MTVTGREKKSRYRVQITLDDDRKLVLSEKSADAFGFEEGAEIPEDIWEEFLAQMKSECIARCGKLLQDMDYSAENLKEKLIRSGYPEEAAVYAVEKMIEAHYVDDQRFATTYLKYHLQDKSLLRIRMDLKAKGVPDEIVEQAVDSLQAEDGGFIQEREKEQAKRLLKKRHFDPENVQYDEIRKQMAYLFGKGYGMDVIRLAMEELEKKSEENGS